MCKRSILLGETIYEKSKPIGRSLLIDIAEYYLNANTLEAIEKLHAIIETSRATGRAGEVANASYSLSWYNPELECLAMDWSESKTAQQKFMLFFADRYNYKICIMNSFFRWFIIGAGCQSRRVNENSGALSFLRGRILTALIIVFAYRRLDKPSATLHQRPC